MEMTELHREIRQILLGYLAYNGNKIVAGKGLFDRSFGLFSGNASARVLGVTDTKRRYTFPSSEENMREHCREAFFRLGRQVELRNAEGVDAVLYAPVFYNPAVLLCEYTEDGMILTVCTARTTTVFINAAHAFYAWERQMPGKLQSELLPKEKKESKRKIKREARKEARREKRKEKRQETKKKLARRLANSQIVKNAGKLLSEAEQEPTQEMKAEKPRHGK